MKICFYSMLLGLSVVGLLSSCSNDSDSNADNSLKPIDIPADTRSYVSAGNEFSFKLMQTLSDKTDENFAVSPLSITLALSMFANTQTDLQSSTLEFLGFGNDRAALERTNEYCRRMLVQLPVADRTTTCRFANSFWTDDRSLLTSGSTSSLRENYLAEIFEKNPSGEKMRGEINNWISRNTDGLISEFLKTPLDCDFALINTAYFHGTWEKKFDRENTRKEIFHNADGSVIRCDFMKQENLFSCYEDEYVQLVALPYGNGNFEMTVILPQEGTDLNTVINSIDSNKFLNMRNNASACNVILSIPKFTTEYSKDLTPTFKNLGLKIENGKTDIQLAHGVAISVDEEGTVAAATSGVLGSGAMNNSVEMVCDRPFAYVIRETTTGAIIFAGRLMKL